MTVKVSGTGLDIIVAGTKREHVRVVWDEHTSVSLENGEVRLNPVGIEIVSDSLSGVTHNMAALIVPWHRVWRVEFGPEKKWRDATGGQR